MTETLASIKAQGRTTMAEASLSQTKCVGNQKQGSIVNWAGEKDGKKFQKLQLSVSSRWIFIIERYFTMNEISEAERLQASGVCLEGKALNWYNWTESKQQMLTQKDFKRELLSRLQHSEKKINMLS